MKVGVVGVGAVGSAVTMALLGRGTAREIVLIDRDSARARGVALDMRYGTLLLPPVNLHAGDYDDLTGAELVIVTAGVNEAAGGATDRADPAGRLRLLDTNADVYREIIPALVAAAPQATIMVVTDPPDPLADLARVLAGHDRVFSTGTVLDSGEVVVVPNGQIVQVTNLSRDWARAVVDVPLPANVDVVHASELLRQVGQAAFDDEQLRPLLLDAPTVMGVESFDVDQVNLRMVARTLPGKQFEVGRELRARVAVAFQREGIGAAADLTVEPPTGDE